MELFGDILKYTLPALIAVLAAYFILKAYLDSERRKREAEIRKDDRQVTLPLRLQAYERLVLLLERVSPAQLVLRTLAPGQGPYQFQALLLQAIRDEFEHNQSQQVFVSDQAWLLLRNAKEELVRVINTSSTTLKEELTAQDLARQILTDWSNLGRNPLQEAIDGLKQEARELF
jgi:hypothetical protein